MAGILSTNLTSCGDEGDEGGKSGTAGVIGAWSIKMPKRGENIFVFLAGGEGVNINIPEPESYSLAPLATMNLDATTRLKGGGISMEGIQYTLPGEDGTPGTIHISGYVSPIPYEVKGNRLYLTTEDEIFELTRMAGAGNEKDMPVGLWLCMELGDRNFLPIPASGKAMFSGFRAYCLPTGSSTGYLYLEYETYPSTYKIKGKEMHVTNPDSKYEKVFTLIDTKVLEGTWKTETQKAYYTYTFYPYDPEEGGRGRGRGVATRTMKSSFQETEFPFDYVIFDETQGVVILDSDDSESFYKIDGKTMTVYEDAAMTRIIYEMTKE